MRAVLAVLLLALVGAALAAPRFANNGLKGRLGSAECDICTWVVTQAESLLANNHTEQEIITELDKACSIFGPFSAECQSLVSTYVPQIVALLEQKVPPSEICQQIGLCTSVKASKLTSQMFNKAKLNRLRNGRNPRV